MDLQNAAIWLTNKVRATNPNRKTANRGCVLLHGHEASLPNLLQYADELVKQACSRVRPGDPIGECKLTNISLKIGEYTIQDLDLGVAPFWESYTKDKIAIGNLFLSALYATGPVRIMRDENWQGHPLRAPYVVKHDKHTKGRLSHHTSFVPIDPVERVMQANKAPLVKRWTNKDDYKVDTERAWVKAANTLQSTAWQVNLEVLEVLQGVHKATIPNPDHIIIPDEPGPEQKAMQRDKSRAKAALNIYDKAEEVGDRTFWQYIDFDWRGRIYYKESYFNYQGSDLARGLMQFAEGKPLGEHGNFWLAVHTANSYNQSYHKDEIPDWCEADYRTYLDELGLEDISVDKMTLNDRARWTAERMDEFILTSTDVLHEKAEKPVVFLACCIEWSKWDQTDSNDYICHLPIPIDGSNNGWQHLGAMSKDTVTGDLVGLIPVDIPRDFYVRCAQQLTDRLPEWFAEREMPMKHIRKGIAKRGAMTRAYSAGASTIADNMEADLWQEGFDEAYDIDRASCEMLAKELVQAVADVCPGPLSTMAYLQTLAQHEIDSGAKELTWTSPAGFPVTQTYNLMKDTKVNGRITPVHGKIHDEPIGTKREWGYDGQISHSCHVDIGRPDRKKIASAISPNFVHSQDAAHMALVLAYWDGPFGAVHDSFSCHAADVELLMERTRQTFVDMYDYENFFDHMKHQLLTSTDGFEDNQPQLGDLEITAVLDSDYFFA